MKLNYLFLPLLFLFSCVQEHNEVKTNSKNVEEIENAKESEDIKLSKAAYYKWKMTSKRFSLKVNGPCDDALRDTVHQRYVPYIESKELNGSEFNLEFKFKDACCQEFMGDYKVENDTLYFEFEQVNDVVCSCICWYKYKLELKNVTKKFSEVKIIGLQSLEWIPNS